jgi:putative oxidoreductase
VKSDLGLLLLRVGFGGIMLLAHGLGKLFSFSEKAETWADPIGLGPQLSLSLAIGAEVFCALAIVVGLFTRLATIPLMITMLVAGVVAHSADPWKVKELAFIYLIGFAAIALLGPGRLSLDAIRGKLFSKKK